MNQRMAFEGIKVIDFTWVGVGPITIKYLADHGATVVRVESVSHPDDLRGATPFKDGKPGINRSQFSASYNTSKYGLGLNMGKTEARELVKRMISVWQPDIVAETFTPRVMRKWGLDYDSVKKLKPDVIYFSACQQGQTGPNAMFAGFGMQSSAMAGFYHITGWPDRGPVPPYGAYSDFINPPNAVTAIIAALEYRRRTGKGQRLDLSQFECATHYMEPAFLDYQLSGRIMGRQGNRDEAYAPHAVYPCNGHGETRWCAIAVTSEMEWQGLRRAMGDPAWARAPRFANVAGRKQHEDELDVRIGRWTAGYEAHELMGMLQEMGVPAGVVQSQSDLWDDPQLKHRGFYQWLNHTECGPMPYDGLQFLLSRTPGKLRWAQALIGEHNQLILKEFVGLSNDEISELAVAGALETS